MPLRPVPINGKHADSVRMLLFANPHDSPIPGRFNPSHFGHKGSGILLRMNGIFFCLTAMHNLKTAHEPGWQLGDPLCNRLPFWVAKCPHDEIRYFNPDHSLNVDAFLLPSLIWDISKLIDLDIPYVDTKDLCLIQLYDPILNGGSEPQGFIDLDAVSMPDESLCANPRVLQQIIGYPDTLAGKDIGIPPAHFEYYINMERQMYFGVYDSETEAIEHSSEAMCRLVRGMPQFQPPTHEEIKGMSGGGVFLLDRFEFRWCGILVSSASGRSRYIPCHLFHNALLNYKASNPIIVDPQGAERALVNCLEELDNERESLCPEEYEARRQRYCKALVKAIRTMEEAKRPAREARNACLIEIEKEAMETWKKNKTAP